MRPVSGRSFLAFLAFNICALGLILALIDVPQAPNDLKFWIFGMAGLLPLAFAGREWPRYIGYVTAMAAIFGIASYVIAVVPCTPQHSHCGADLYPDPGWLCLYAVYGAIAFVIWRLAPSRTNG